jgi:hypothetical protein
VGRVHKIHYWAAEIAAVKKEVEHAFFCADAQAAKTAAAAAAAAVCSSN